MSEKKERKVSTYVILSYILIHTDITFFLHLKNIEVPIKIE